MRCRNRGNVLEIGLRKDETRSKRIPLFEGLLVEIQSQYAAAGRRAFEQSPGVPAGAESRVDVAPSRLRVEVTQDFVEQYSLMPIHES